MSFARPDLLVLALLLPAVVAACVAAYARRRRRVAESIGDAALLRRIGAGELWRFPLRRLLLVGLAAASLGVAAAGPRWGSRIELAETQSLNMVLALDVSRSMLAEDVAPNRLEAMRIFARRLTRELQGDRIGLVAFSGRAYVLTPMTIDGSALDLYLDALDPEIVSQGGSALSAAIAQATDLVRAREQVGGDRVVVLVSDGEALEEVTAVRAAADRARRAGVTIHTVGVGTTTGSTVPQRDPLNDGFGGVTRDEHGEVVISRLDEAMLTDIARRSGGRYFRMDGLGGAGRVIAELGGMQREATQQQRVTQPDRFALFVALALLLLALDAALALPGRARWPMALLRPRSGWLTRPLARRAATLALLLVVTGFGVGDVERGNRHYRAGRYAEAVEAYESALRAGRATPELHYNLGTALLRLGRESEADAHFARALQSVEPDLRQRTYYNLGTRHLEAGRAAADGTRQLDAAVEAYRDALRLDPSDLDAKWNLELALRERERQEQQQPPQQNEPDPEAEPEDDDDGEDPGQGDGAGGGAAGQGGAGRDDRTGLAPGELTQEEADRILNAADQDELQVARERLRKGQRRTPVLRDW
jgi:Ca-activated chloride channel homolog